jgi:hypothetical protein
MTWYYWSDERQAAVGPLTEEELMKLFDDKVICHDSRVAPGGAQEWKLFQTAFPNAGSDTQSVSPSSHSVGERMQSGKDLAARLVYFAGGRLRRAWSVATATRRSRIWATVILLLVSGAGFKIHGKIEKERLNKEFRERVLANRRNRPVSDYFVTNTLRQCPQCKGKGVVKRTSFPSPGTDWARRDPGMCPSCGGQGTFINPSGRSVECKDCNGRGFSPVTSCGMCNGRGTVAE